MQYAVCLNKISILWYYLVMEYKSFEEFYKSAEIVAKQIRNEFPENAITAKLVEDFTEIRKCFFIGKLPFSIQSILMSNTEKLQISFCNLVKNIAKHPEIDIKKFNNLMIYINSAEKQYYNKDKMIFEKNIENNLYQIVIKTTKNKNENYVLSFYKANHKKR